MSDAHAVAEFDATPLPLLAVRGVIGGTLMGLANLVPGISGGTMLLAAGVYPRFITAIGEVTTLKFRLPSMVILGSVVLAAVVAIGLLSDDVKDLVVNHRWVMYSLFIGLTLGGVPVVWRLIDKPTSSMWIAAVVGFVGMAGLAYFQGQGAGTRAQDGFVLMLLAGVAGASAMILPGVSGGYLLLVLGVYVPILAGIGELVDAIKATDIAAATPVFLGVVLPVGIGVVVGVVGVSNLLRYLLSKHELPTLGVLLGLLLGAVVGLWPFQQPVEAQVGDTLKGQQVVMGDYKDDEEKIQTGLIFEDTGKPVEADDLPTAMFTPTGTQIGGSLGLILLGFAVTLGIDFIGKDRKKAVSEQNEAREEGAASGDAT